jgi:hypothetical protein
MDARKQDVTPCSFSCYNERIIGLQGWALCALILVACAQGTSVSTKAGEDTGGRGYCKTTVCGQGIISVYKYGAIDFHPWIGPRREWQAGAEIEDCLVGYQGVVYLLEEKGLFSFNLTEGPKSLTTVMHFRENQRYLEIIGEAEDGIWLFRPDVAVDRVGNGRVLEHVQADQLPVPPAYQGNRARVLLSYVGMVGEVPYLAMMYGRQSYGYLVYNPVRKDWDAHFMRGDAALMPLVLEGNKLKELAVCENAQSFPAPPGLALRKSTNANGLYERLGPNLFLTGMIGSPSSRQGVIVIDTSKRAILFHRDSPDLSRQGVYVKQSTVWIWDLGWNGRPRVSSFRLPPRVS